MRSSDFGPIVSPIGVGSTRRAKGGAARKPHHLTVIIAMPSPLMGALAQAAAMPRPPTKGALQVAGRRRR